MRRVEPWDGRSDRAFVYRSGSLLLRILTNAAIVAGLLPILWSTGSGSEAMQHIAAPMVGGMLSVALLTLAVIPATHLPWQSRRHRGKETPL